MANIETSNDWPSGVYQYADGDVLDGGADSSEVLPIKQLANRSLFQRLANLTPWDSALALSYGYPLKACVMHEGLSWRAKVANSVEPSTDALKWERWGYSESELDTKLAALWPFGTTVACVNTGPTGSADKTKIHKSTLGEYWMWLGDAWMVVANYHNGSGFSDNYSLTANSEIIYGSYTPHRTGRIVASMFASGSALTVGHEMMVRVRYNGGDVAADNSIAPGVESRIRTSCATSFLATAGQQLNFQVFSSESMSSTASVRWGVNYTS